MPDFGGDTFDEALDGERLRGQWADVWAVMSRPVAYNWYTLRQLSDLTGHPESSVSARIRDFRKPRFGGHFVDRRRREPGDRGLFEYRLTIRVPMPPGQAELRFEGGPSGAEAR